MTRSDLEQYASIRQEIRELEQRLRDLEDTPDRVVPDRVQASMSEHPYIRISIPVERVIKTHDRAMRRTQAAIAERRDRLAIMQADVEEWLSTLTDSKLRRIIQLRYIDGKSWTKTANAVYGYPCESRARMQVMQHVAP